MVYQFTCATCTRYLGDIIYYFLIGNNMDEIVEKCDVIKYGRMCCITHLYTMTPRITYHPPKIEFN